MKKKLRPGMLVSPGVSFGWRPGADTWDVVTFSPTTVALVLPRVANELDPSKASRIKTIRLLVTGAVAYVATYNVEAL